MSKSKKESVAELQARFAMIELNLEAIKFESRPQYVDRMEAIYFELGKRRVSIDVLHDFERRLSLCHSALKGESK